MRPSTCDGNGWRFNSGPSRVQSRYGKNCSAVLGIPEVVGGVSLLKTLLHASRMPREPGGPRELDLLKLDADGPEGLWLEAIERYVRRGTLRVESMIVEGSHLSPALMHKLDVVHGYTFYRLDEHDGRRSMDRNGWDRYSPPGTIARLDRLRAKHVEQDHQQVKYSPRSHNFRPAGDGVSRFELEEELFGVRAMKHVFRVKRNISEQGWVTVLNPVLRRGYPPQFALTQLPDLTEPSFQNTYAKGGPEHRDWVERSKNAEG
eukprot:CAMPEP_0185313366 /NCGR_PEP_ID=MMETSP1363-20130426/35500_1 /TAXON_ID=38817 /ORGANISM="Gephyrocapsa oceanica, Strain RCC1303" /LENGTH=260 /DNA_ID=CAMNT_0027911273 /DNA_START=50 /DNA_END=832 /DNA_ORIENTATION=-